MATDSPRFGVWFLPTNDMSLWFRSGTDAPEYQMLIWCSSWRKDYDGTITLRLQGRVGLDREYEKLVDFPTGITIYLLANTSCGRSDIFDPDRMLFKIINCHQTRAWCSPQSPYGKEETIMNCLVRGEIGRKF